MKQGKEKLKIPIDYFEQLSKKVLKKIQHSEVYEELYSISTFVAQHLKKKNLFKIPENYFETLPERLQSKIRPASILVFRRELIFAVSAASVLVIFMLSVWFLQPDKHAVYTVDTVQTDEKMIFTALATEQDEATLEAEAARNKEVLVAVAQSIEQQNILPKNTLEQETDLDKNLEHELEKALENELDNL